jgi:hypothetical protein
MQALLSAIFLRIVDCNQPENGVAREIIVEGFQLGWTNSHVLLPNV